METFTGLIYLVIVILSFLGISWIFCVVFFHYKITDDQIEMLLFGIFKMDKINFSEINEVHVVSRLEDRIFMALRYGTKSLNPLQSLFCLVSIKTHHGIMVIAPTFPSYFTSELRRKVPIEKFR
jgi:hypothetical protein